ncbi:hypothetical protein [Acetobacter cerevisiae]|uniref:hypothetical protein n=1 Tax=Acetobacter cerevisiae TaxID=178900 RepID=UPI000A590F73|nr:hypothetical protein [Acetobacter cerevisiae]
MDGSQAVDAARQKALNTPSNPRLANLVRDAARRWKIDNQEYCKKIHLKRAKILGCAAIIERIYSARGDDFEDAFSSLLDFVAVNYKKLDQKGKIGYPDFLIDVDSLPSVVVELKTKVSNTDMVAFNAAVEVLSASELIGFRDNPCLTVCSPSVEPSVPQLIERCGRLSVVEVCDLAEAALRLKEEKLTRSEFYNWITTPGIALREDLPVSC